MGIIASIPDGIKEVYFNLTGFNQYGLLHDDVLMETDVVVEAIKRLPPQMQVKSRMFPGCPFGLRGSKKWLFPGNWGRGSTSR